MPLQNWQSVEQQSLPVLGLSGRVDNEVIIRALHDYQDYPFRIRAATPESSIVQIGASSVTQGDRTTILALPFNSSIQPFPLTTIDFSSGVINGGTVLRNETTFSLPVSTPGSFIRAALVYVSQRNYVNVIFSSSVSQVSNLQNIADLLSGVDGLFLGYLDLEAHASQIYKTVGETTPIIRQSSVNRFFGYVSNSRNNVTTHLNGSSGILNPLDLVVIQPNGGVSKALANQTGMALVHVGIIYVGSNPGQNTQVITRDGTFVDGFSNLIIGKDVFVSRNNAGAVTQDLSNFITGDTVYRVGKALSATKIVYEPEHLYEIV